MPAPTHPPIAAMVFVLGVIGCAGTQTSVVAPATPAPTVDDAPTTTVTEASVQHAAVPLQGGRGLLRLCEALRQSDSVNYTGNAVEQARQRALHEQRRTEASDGRYEIAVPAEGFSFAGYDLDEGRLRLSDQRFAIEDGIELDRASSDEAMGFRMTEAAAERLLQMRAEGKLSLRIVFSPQGSQMRPDVCIAQSGGRMIKLGASVLAAYLVGPVGAPLARYETEAFAQEMAGVTPVRTPKVLVGKAISADTTAVAPPVQATLAKLDGPLLVCYREALARRSTTQGTLIVGITIGKDGRAQQARMEMSTINDEGFVACAVDQIGRTLLPTSVPLPGGLSLPVTFGDAPQ